jgi:hypothetical protein
MWYVLAGIGAILGFVVLAGVLLVRAIVGNRSHLRRCPSCHERTLRGLTCESCGYEAEAEVELRQRRKDLVRGLVGLATLMLGSGLGLWAIWDATPALDGELELLLLEACWYAGALAALALATALGAWAWWPRRSRGRRRCPKCWYDMHGTPGLVCPECGHEVKKVKHLYRTQKRWKTTAAALLLLVVGAGLLATPRVRGGGPASLIPTTVLIVGFEWLPDWAVWDDQQWEGSSTLRDRLFDDDMWAWQVRWLRLRCRAALIDGPSPRTAWRSFELYVFDPEQDNWDPRIADEVARLKLRTILEAPGPNRDRLLGYAHGPPIYPDHVGAGVIDEIVAHTPELIGALGETEGCASDVACELILAARGRCEAALPVLLQLMDDDPWYARWALGAIITDSTPARHAALDALPGMERAIAVCQMLEPACADQRTVETLLSYTRARESDLAAAGLIGLARMNAEPDIVIPSIIRAVADEGQVPWLIGYVNAYGDALAPHVGAVCELLEHDDPDLVTRTAEVLATAQYRMSDPRPLATALDALDRLGTHENEKVRAAAADAARGIREAIAEHEGQG